MYTYHLFEEHIYLISNHSVARNPMFATEELQTYFIKKMEHHLNPISEIIAYNLNDNEFQILVKLRERGDFVEHFLGKKNNKDVSPLDIPESTYIFSQAMANLQVSFVKHFNWKFQRSGTLLAGRFSRKLIETPDEMNVLINRLNSGTKKHSFSSMWRNDLMTSGKILTSEWLYRSVKGGKMNEVDGYLDGRKPNLVSCFKSLPPYRLYSTKNYFIKRIHRLYGPFAPPKN